MRVDVKSPLRYGSPRISHPRLLGGTTAMQTSYLLLLTLGLCAAPGEAVPERGPDLTLLQELLRDRQHPRGQSQAALLLLQNPSSEAEAIVRQGLQQTEDVEIFQALAGAVRISQDNRFLDELFKALASPKAQVRQAAAETLALVPNTRLLARLHALVNDPQADLASRQAGVWILGRGGRKRAVHILLEQLDSDSEPLRRSAAEALAELSGQNYGMDATRWQAWWEKHRELSPERWLEHRLAYQAARSQRLEGELERSRTQVIRLHQQLYSRLPQAERFSYIQAVLDQEDAAVRGLAVAWAAEMLVVGNASLPRSDSDAARQQALTQVLLRLSQDSAAEVQRSAVLALGRVNDPAAFERLQVLLQQGRAPVRAAAARSLTLQARGTGTEATQKQKVVVPALQKALDDPALEVVVEAAEDLGMLGALEAGPVLTSLLHHPSGHVRQAAAQALERVADVSLLDGLLKGLTDPSVNVRFSLLGALARAVGKGTSLNASQQVRLLTRLEALLLRDSDPGVRSRAATVLGECAPPASLGLLWKCVQSAEDSRVQEKAWAGFVEVIARSARLPLLQEWDRALTAAHQGPRRLQLLTEVVGRWQKTEETRSLAGSAQEMLVQAQLELGKWSAAFPQVRDLLARPGSAAEMKQRLKWLLTVGEQALQEGNRSEAQRAVVEARQYLTAASDMVEAFEKLARRAGD